MEDDHQDIIPKILIDVYIPVEEEQYNVLTDLGMGEFEYYFTVESLLRKEGIDSPYTKDQLPIFYDLYAN